MSKKIIGIGFLLAMAVIFTLNSCSKTTTVLVDNAVAVTGTVSFSKDIQPILTKSCAVSGCHSGTISPNLGAATAYNALVSGNFVSTGTPTSSEVYLWLTGKRSIAMPAGSTNNPSNINALMLAWIEQGAKNN